MEQLEGRRYGPQPFRFAPERVAEFVAVTLDDAERWREIAPPGFAAAALFVVAPLLLTDPVVLDMGPVVHGDQRFVWHRPLDSGLEYAVVGTVSRVRVRSGTAFVTFDLDVSSGEGPVVEGTSTFLVTAPPGASARAVDEEPEPHPLLKAASDPLPETGTFRPLARSASRSDLVRYAGATGDWNPIHWDHQTALSAGLPGVVVHGLLQVAWILTAASRCGIGAAPLADARIRFRSPLRPGVAAIVQGEVEGKAVVAELVAAGAVTVAATVGLR